MNTSVESLTHKMQRAAVGKMVDVVLSHADKDRQKTVGQLVDVAKQFYGSSFSAEAYEHARQTLTDPDSKWSKLINCVLDQTDPNVARTMALNLGYEAFFRGTKTIRENRVKYQCNIPWLILFDPTSACNMHCVGCWAGEYGHKNNLSFEDMDKIVTEGKELGDKIMSMMGTIPVAFVNPLPSLYPLDLLVGLCCGAGLRLAVYLRGKNAKKYRHGMEYGSARWGTPKDIEPFMAPKFADNIILTKTERLMMSNRPPDPKNARNKNVLVVGGSGSGKTRFWLKPNLLQCHSSYVVTDPKGSIVVECGNALLKNGYKVRILNTINFKKSMHYNPFAYVHSEKDILKLVTTLMTNTKGEGSGGDPFWEKSERLLLTALIAYLHYEAPVEEQNFATLLEMLNTMQVLEDDEEYQNPVDLLFEELGKKKPNSFAVRQYKLYKLAAGDICSK